VGQFEFLVRGMGFQPMLVTRQKELFSY